MHCSVKMAILTLLTVGIGAGQEGQPPDTKDAAKTKVTTSARAALDRGDAREAVRILEAALIQAGREHRKPIRAMLAEALNHAVRQAERDGRSDEAAEYRAHLEILERAPRSTIRQRLQAPDQSRDAGDERPPAAKPDPMVPDAPPPVVAPVIRASRSRVHGEGRSGNGKPPTTEEIAQEQEHPDTTAAPKQVTAAPRDDEFELADRLAHELPQPQSSASRPEESPRTVCEKADEHFRAKRYVEAGDLYRQLFEAGKLPQERRAAWGYCRRVDVMRRIADGPKRREEWDAILGEIEAIRALSPQPWHDEYLRSLVNDLSGGARPPTRRGPVVRGASPDELPLARPPTRPQATREKELVLPRSESRDAEAELRAETRPASQWQVLETTNFHVYHANADLARRVATAAEEARDTQFRKWTGREPPATWSPPCHVYVYPDGSALSRHTGQPSDSPGFSTTGTVGTRITARRINLRADHAKVVDAVLPHEVTHVVLADIFSDEPPPRWADEGMAALAEPETELLDRKRALRAHARFIPLRNLLSVERPDAESWPVYYAQSVALTDFLVGRMTPPGFVQFLRNARRTGFDSALRSHAGIENVPALEREWLAYQQATQ